MFCLCSGFTANAQDGQFNTGANIGLPTGDASDLSSFSIGIEANYLFEVSDEFKVGASVSYVTYLGKSVTILGQSIYTDNSSVLPIAAAARYSVSENFVLGDKFRYKPRRK